MGLITLPNNFEKILDKTEKKKAKNAELGDDNNNNNNNNNCFGEDGPGAGLEVSKKHLPGFIPALMLSHNRWSVLVSPERVLQAWRQP